jgi:hypothetical protein
VNTEPRSLRYELLFVLLAAWLVFASIPVVRGNLGLSWDALNHHIYLGWNLESRRLGADRLAGAYQTYQPPHIYWPGYKLAVLGADGVTAGVVLATIHLVVVPPVWMLARTLMPGAGAFEVAMRLLAVLLAFMTAVVLKLFEATSNDLLAAAPFVWALALGLEAIAVNKSQEQVLRLACWSGLLAGASVGLKLSSGPLAIVLPILWFMAPGPIRSRLLRVASAALLCVAGFVVVYGWWGWQLWVHFGNPLYPFYDYWFEPLRALTGWAK